MKFLKYPSLIALMVVGFSCSDDDKEAKPSLEKVTISLSENQQVLEVPQALLASEDPNAQQAASWVALANGMGSNLALFTPPAGATKTTTPITPENGRAKAGASVVVYTWDDAQYGSVAYQIQEVSNKYTFELFYKGLDDSGWQRYLYAEELKDRSAGYMALYDIWGSMSETGNAEMMRWEWTRQGDIFTFELSSGEAEFSILITVNTKTKAGSVVYFESKTKSSEMIWDAQGKGEWKYFDETGAVTEEGTWS